MTAALRRGLPRVPGGEPWPLAPAATGDDAGALTGATPVAVTLTAGAPAATSTTAVATASSVPGDPAPGAGRPRGEVALRRGLPRVPGGEPWPPAGWAPAVEDHAPAPQEPAPEPAAVAADEAPGTADASPTTESDPGGLSPRARRSLGMVAVIAVLGIAAVLGARLIVGLDGVQAFVARYPGAVPPPEGAPVGIPTWLSWTHFFNVFLLAMIVRTGLEVRRQARPEAYWARRSDPRTRISLLAWTHQALDVLWVVNGVTYVVLLFATGQWMRIVPLSWEVVPNAVSTALQYLSLDWPVEDGWAYYNSLQQLSYVVTVFIAAPLAIATGVRMSIFWRAGGRLDRLYPVTVARRIHFPVMLYFVLFVVSHVALVLATGARRNLNHMFAGTQGEGWTGAIVATAALAVVVGAVLAVRPLLIAPVARRFGTVSGR
ncbi:cytochrome b/b6 domain-containing protein [Demequina lignilytica]|uniref:Cytochrome b/b6 domain-containing protein n=1 Tax=Demequina lignilytica TaxID=3051663 RepID=A0AB35MEN1_9MICO|nr:cytochrome b/b6 domain-containing protein [Demequina sp. SYSU T0a273]MDN4482206.1 cytochrome b/b6 domain-containing protein [Demequina sp. SYSU T0a273]